MYRTFRITGQGVYLSGKDNPKEYPKRKQYLAVYKEDSMKMLESLKYNPKPSDLILGKVKWDLGSMEA